MQLLNLIAISLKDIPETQTRAFYHSTTAWLAQWHATNNYGPIMIDNDQSMAWRIWRDKFLSQFRDALSYVAEPPDGLVNHFTFTYQLTELNLNQEGTYIGKASVDLCDIETEPETELTEFGKECEAYAAKLCMRFDWLDDLHLVVMRPGSLFMLFEEDEDDDDTRGYISISTSDGKKLNNLHKELYKEVQTLVGEEVAHDAVLLGTKAIRVSLAALRILDVPLPLILK